ncbi:MAG TPA: hypothetical protein VM580_30125, partial [Labilithrix sp.]|nr:hypothetical protein [Labilithrix sp.]
LEGRYRAVLGDVAGASLAFARLRERAGREIIARSWLAEAARFEEARGELALAQAHLAAALAVVPTDAEIETHYRAVSDRIARAAGVRPVVEVAPAMEVATEAAGPAPSKPAPLSSDVPPEGAVATPPDAPDMPDEGATPTEEEDEARVETLTRLLQADPTNDAVVDELTTILTRRGRGMDLLALLAARLEDAPPERREELLPRHRAVLEHLESEARVAGREAEAELFKMAREASL